MKLNKLKNLYRSLLVIVCFIVFGSSFIGNSSEKYSVVTLGKLLFSEKILSKDSSVSCASCHKPAFAFADTAAFSKGINNHFTGRNTPSVLNMKNRPYYFFDGRAGSLAEQALMPIQNPDEMGLTIETAIERLNQSDFYKNYFTRVFKRLPDKKNLAIAFAAYEKTLETVDSRFDDWSNNLNTLSPSEERGREIFIGEKAKCFDCHFQEDFTNDDFKNIGLFNGTTLNDSGRAIISKAKADIGKFKTPGLRNVAVTAPYMHNGMFRTLEEVVDYYNDTKKYVPNPVNIDPSLMNPLGLNDQEKKDLVAFLKTLTDKAFYNISK